MPQPLRHAHHARTSTRSGALKVVPGFSRNSRAVRAKAPDYFPAAMLTRLLAFLLLLVLPASAAPLSGTKSVGPTGDYASLTAAIADVQAVGNGLGGALVLELQPGYVSTVETFPLTIPALNGASAVNTLTIRPVSGATALSISSADTTAATVDLNGAQFVTIDGRPAGVGSNAGSGGGAASQLTIANTSTAGVTLRFINEASSNTIRFTTLRGVNTSFGSGVVRFSATTGANGNDNNTIDHCDIGDGASTPTNGIYSSGSNSTTAQNNSGNTISNCNIFNFYAATAIDSAGVRLGGGNTGWSLTGNSFYQTASRAAVSANVLPIYLANTFGNNFTVTGNFIGGSAPNAGGTPWTTTGTSAIYRFVGIQLTVGSATASSVQGNTIANIVWTSSFNTTVPPGAWSGIHLQTGSADIGTVTGNTIGSGSGTGSISVTISGSGATSFGIGSSSTGPVAIANNTIGSITVNGTSTSVSASLTGVHVSFGPNIISNNTVGSATTANSLNAATSSASATGQQVTGILSTSGNIASITGNTVANLNNNYIGVGSAGQIRGITTFAGVNTITGNTVRNLSTTSLNTDFSSSHSVYGISQTSTTAGQTVSQNTVHSLANTAASASVSVTGIYFAGPTSGTNLIARNLVHSLAVSSPQSPELNGMYFDTGTFTAQNNMVRLGLQADGSSTAGAAFMVGIYDYGTNAGRNFYHNSAYIGGTQTIAPKGTFTFFSRGTTNLRTIRNNIFVNARNNSGGTGGHYAVFYSGTGVNPAGLTSGGNLFRTSGAGGVLGNYNGDLTTLAAWQTATGQDATSAVADPLFIAPTGDATTVDLHISTNSPANNAGLAIGVTDDFDGEARNLTTPAIGADEAFVPNIAVEQPVGNGLTDGVSTKDFGTATVNSGSVVASFKITNSGGAALISLAVTVDGANAGDFGISQPASTTLAPGASTFFDVSFTPTVAGTRSAAIHIASNVSGAKNPFDIVLMGTGLTVLENWRQTFYGTTSNTGNAADSADPYHTGVPNLAVFAVLGPNQDPARVASGLLPQPEIIGGNYVISFTQPGGVSGVSYGAEWRADLLPGSWTTMTHTVTGTAHTFSVNIAGNPPIFIRLRVSTP